MYTPSAINKPLHVGKICFTDGTELIDKTVFITNGFLIVDDGDGINPVWHNLNSVAFMSDVTVDYAKAPRQRIGIG